MRLIDWSAVVNDTPSRPIRIRYSDPNALVKRRLAARLINLDSEEIESEDYCTIEVVSPAIEGNQ